MIIIYTAKYIPDNEIILALNIIYQKNKIQITSVLCQVDIFFLKDEMRHSLNLMH